MHDPEPGRVSPAAIHPGPGIEGGHKNRLHLDLELVRGRRDDELARLLNCGAVEVADYRGKHGPGTGWVVLADPEGNEFCILRNTAERST